MIEERVRRSGRCVVLVRDADLFKLIDKLGQHYQNNINNRYARQSLLSLTMDRQTWDRVESLAQPSEYARLNGFSFEELYEMIVASATFVSRIRKELVPNLRTSLSGGADRDVLRHMVINNYAANLGIYADMINEVYLKTVALDREEHPEGRRVYERVPGLKDVGKLLITG